MRSLFWIVLVLVTLGGGSASAQPADESAITVAEQQLAAIEAFKDGRFEDAVALARAVLSLNDEPVTGKSRLVLALSLEALGDEAGALEALDGLLALEILPSDRQRAGTSSNASPGGLGSTAGPRRLHQRPSRRPARPWSMPR